MGEGASEGRPLRRGADDRILSGQGSFFPGVMVEESSSYIGKRAV